MAQSVGIKDVARAAGVSVGTVSNVINRPDTVATETRARVLSAIDRLGYVRSESARQLRAGRSRIMGLLVLDMGNPFFVDVARGAERAAREAGLGVMVCNSAQNPSEEAEYLSLFAEQRVRGVLLTPADATGRNIEAFRRHGIPFVLVDRVAEGTTECSVSVDDVAGGALAVRHLVDAGHRSLAYVSGPPGLNQVRDRRTGALEALAEAGLGPDALRELPTERLDVAAGRDAGARLLGLADRPTAVFCANDLLALGVLQAMYAAGVGVPDDLAIVGYDDIEFAAAAAVPLTSVRQPAVTMGAWPPNCSWRRPRRRARRAARAPTGRPPARAGGAPLQPVGALSRRSVRGCRNFLIHGVGRAENLCWTGPRPGIRPLREPCCPSATASPESSSPTAASPSPSTTTTRRASGSSSTRREVVASGKADAEPAVAGLSAGRPRLRRRPLRRPAGLAGPGPGGVPGPAARPARHRPLHPRQPPDPAAARRPRRTGRLPRPLPRRLHRPRLRGHPPRLTGGAPWTVLGQSFGGFCAVTYLSPAPEGLSTALITGGLPSLDAHADDVYRAAYPRIERKVAAHYARYPQDVERARRIADHLARARRRPARTATGSPSRRSSPSASSSARGDGSHRLHYLLEDAFVRTPPGPHSPTPSRRQVQGLLVLRRPPAVRARSTRRSTARTAGATAWAAERVRAEFPQFDAAQGPRGRRPAAVHRRVRPPLDVRQRPRPAPAARDRRPARRPHRLGPAVRPGRASPPTRSRSPPRSTTTTCTSTRPTRCGPPAPSGACAPGSRTSSSTTAYARAGRASWTGCWRWRATRRERRR